MNEKVLRGVCKIAVLFIAGGYLIVKKENNFSKALVQYIYKECVPSKVSRFLGWGMWGIAIACIPSVLSIVLQKMWLNYITVVLLIGVLGGASVFEKNGGLK